MRSFNCVPERTMAACLQSLHLKSFDALSHLRAVHNRYLAAADPLAGRPAN
jgi:hypothetical protein